MGYRSGRWAAVVAALVVATACSKSTLPEGQAPSVQAGGAPTAGAQAAPTAEQSLGQPASGMEGSGQEATTATTGPTGAGQPAPSVTSPSSGGGSSVSGSAVGVTKDSITISASGIWSGPYAALTNKQFDNGFMTWVNEVNARGGIHGRRIVVKKVDNRSTPEGAVAACKEEKTNGSFAVIGLASTSAELDCLDDGRIPALGLGSDRDPESWKGVRTVESMPSVGAAVARFAKARMAAADKKVGVVVLNLGLNIALSLIHI